MAKEQGPDARIERVYGVEGHADVSADVETQNVVLGLQGKPGGPYVEAEFSFGSDADKIVAAIRRAQGKIRRAEAS